jgi:tRNA modification GTPase
VVACAENVELLEAIRGAIVKLTAAPIVGALTKCDLVSKSDKIAAAGWPVISVSATTRAGLGELLEQITNTVLAATGAPDADTPMITRARHRAALEGARGELAAFRSAWSAGSLPAPVAAVHVLEMSRLLDEMIGTVEVDDVLARVFSTFCVGK